MKQFSLSNKKRFISGTRHDLRNSFTLIELLVVLAIVAILSVVVIMTLNPSELLKQARDSNRLSDLSTLNTALSAYSADVSGGFMGTSSIVYVSIPDTSPTCDNLGLPTSTGSGFTYRCVTSQNLKRADGTGWIPVDFTQISFGAPISSLPVDPVNTTTTGNYYTYVSGGSFILTAIPESQKQKTALSSSPNISNYPGVIAMGNNLSLSPLYNPSGLVGYWNFDDGAGTVAKDSSGNGNNGTLMNSPAWQTASNCKVAGCLYFNGTNNSVRVSTAASLQMGTSSMTVNFLINSASWADFRVILGAPSVGGSTGYGIGQHSNPLYTNYDVYGSTGGVQAFTTANLITANRWNNVTVVFSLSDNVIKTYKDGIQMDSRAISAPGNVQNANQYIFIGSYLGASQFFQGYLDDFRVYNRALSVAEILALYNATR